MPTMARKTAFKRGAAGCRERRSGSPQVEAGTAEHDRVAVDGAVQRRRGGQDVALVRDRDVEAAQTLAASVPVGHEAQYRVVERDARPSECILSDRALEDFGPPLGEAKRVVALQFGRGHRADAVGARSEEQTSELQ